jgi:mRNA interferase RelE/StbE
MDVVYARDPLKVLRGMQPAKSADIRAAIARIALDPFAPNNNIRPLRGVPNGYRVRVGDWRASYTVDRRADAIEVFEVAPRGGAYR